jgi:hypothetical protein
MNPEELINVIDDRLEKRFESYAQVQQQLHESFHNKMLSAVETQIKTTVNGKIDRIDKKMDAQDIILKSLDERIKPFEDGVSWFTRAKNGAGWVAGFVGSIVVIGGGIMWLYNQFK